jgi:hypothetical protein
MAETNKFITVSYDKHEQATTTISKELLPSGFTLSLETGIDGLFIAARLRHIDSPVVDSLILDLLMESKDSWLFLESGSISFVLDGNNFELECHESYTDTKTSIWPTGVTEVVYYILDEEFLDNICSANEIDIRISGESSYLDISNKQKSLTRFQVMCRQFYNSFYDSTKYESALTQSTKPSGCFIATVTMGNQDHALVIDLRSFRDNWLLKRAWGIKFTNWYYTHGPKAAKLIEKSITLRKISFYIIVKPLHFITKNFK